MEQIYLDNAATTKVRDEVKEIMMESMEKYFANADSIHDAGIEVSKYISEFKKVFKKLGLNKEDVYFTAGGADANNILINSIKNTYKKGRVISTKIEHPSVIYALEQLNDFEVCYVEIDNYGFVNEDNLKELLNDETVLVSIGFVNSELGTIQDIERLSKIVKEKNKNIVFHTDFVQGLGHVEVDFSKLNVDSISMSSHKIYGPKGVGALYISPNAKLKKSIYGSNEMNKFVPRTISNELVIGFMKAIDLLKKEDISYLYDLKKYLQSEIEKIPDIRINSPLNSSCAILNISILNVKAEIILNYLSSKKIFVSTGSACSSRRAVSRVISEINIDKKYHDGVLRISLSIYNTKEQIDIFIQNLKEIINIVRSYS